MDKGEIWALIARYAAKSISPRDEERLLRWADSDPENRRILDEVIRVWGMTGKALTIPEPDTQKEWLTLMGRIQAEEKNPVRRMYQASYAVGIAAILIITVALYVMLRQTGKVSSEYPRAVSMCMTSDSVKWFYLPDSSKVWLNAHTTLRFDSLFIQRRTWLEGEAYFEVVSNPNAPFIVEAGDIRVTVTGTSFNVKSQHNGNAEVVVVTGKVEVATSDSTVQKKFLLGVEDKGTYVAKDRLLSVSRNGDPHFLDWERNAEQEESLRRADAGQGHPSRDSVAVNASQKGVGGKAIAQASSSDRSKTAPNEETDTLDLSFDRNGIVAGDSSETKNRKISSFQDLSNIYTSKKDAVKRTVIAGSITNLSPTVTYRKIRLKIIAVTSKGKRSEYSLELSSTEPLQPGQSVPYQQTLFDVSSKKTEVNVTIVEAQVAN